jgi:molecular chaperone DnaJ
MKVAEAYSILEVPPGTSADDAKKKYRELTKKFHPDINKDPDAEAKFKKINEAYQVVSTGKSTDREDVVSQSRARNSGGFSHPFGRAQFFENTHVQTHTTISFMDSVWGTKQDIKFSRKAKCTSCNGQGEVTLNNGCTECGGRGQSVNRKGNSIYISTCSKCNGQSSTESCTSCGGEGCVNSETSVQVTIPGGVANGSVLRLSGMGNFVGSFMMNMDQYTDTLLHITVLPEAGLSLDGQDVVSRVDLSLLEAIRGCSKKVKTIMGNHQVEIKPMSRNGDTVLIKNMGVNRTGNQKVILDVKYPNDIDKLVKLLSEEGIS